MLHDQDLVSVQEVRSKVDLAYQAWQTYKTFSQEKVDSIVTAVAAAGRANARRLAELAVDETGMGNVEDKVAKNLLNADLLERAVRGMKTVGVIRELPEQRIVEIGVPVGVVAAILPTTNPTSTAIYKSIISLKAGNAVVLSPHPRAKGCTCATASILAEAAKAAGMPDGVIQCITNPSLEATNALMKHPKTGVILSTGGAGIVRAAYSSGKPAFGVGPGNVPILVDVDGDIAESIRKVVAGKSFDYGTVCSSEQTVVAERSIRDRVLAELKKNNAYLMNDGERAAVEKVLFAGGTTTVRSEAVGQSPLKIAQLAGIAVPGETRILVAEIGGVGKGHPMSAEKLSPVLAVHFVDSFDAALQACETVLHYGGLGHTCVIHSNNDAKVKQFGLRMPAFRVLVNTSSPQGSVGITTALQPSMTLGCGAIAGNITSDNVGPQHLINVKRIAAAVRTVEEAFPPREGETTASIAAVVPQERSTVIEAVEQYLAQRGLKVSASKPLAESPLHEAVASAVERALGQQEVQASCGCLHEPKVVPAVEEVADFVCEDDVRKAMSSGKKIKIGPKTIVTPAARELAGPGGVLVQAPQ
jgi:acyl-CoA reductase-like NAD-dependent aldehyde dehydrogenase